MDEEITIINEKTRNEKIKNFFIENKKILIISITAIIILIIGFYSYQAYKVSHKKKVSDKYNISIIDFKNGNKSEVVLSMLEIIGEKDSTYSPLALYFLIDNGLIESRKEVNDLFDILINKTSLENEIKNLIIYKKALYNADSTEENKLLDILNPIINSKSVWKSHSLYLIAEYFYSKGEKQKSKEFFNQIISLENGNQDIKKEALKRISRDLSD
tara:strand:+ start:273 stop:917 length:645 start_codon:yes stop_codon:yes gene_type:complete